MIAEATLDLKLVSKSSDARPYNVAEGIMVWAEKPF